MFAPSTCVLQYIFLALCSLGCENGGTCIAPDTCDCVAGYSGDRCENGMLIFTPSTCSYILQCILLALCFPACENGGTCTAPDTCDCVDGYSGDGCENGICVLVFSQSVNSVVGS